MYNWSHIDEEAMKRENPEKYRRWRIVELLTNGLDGERLDREEVKALWPDIHNQLDPYTRRAIEFLLWGTIYSLPTNLHFWNKSRMNRT